MFNRPALATAPGKTLRLRIQQTLSHASNRYVNAAIQTVVDKLGGAGTFVSAHFRMGDGSYALQREKNMQMLVDGILTEHGAMITDAKSRGDSLPVPLNESVLYIATDDPGPRKSPFTAPLRALFRDVRCLKDFSGEINAALDGWWGDHITRLRWDARKALILFAWPIVEQGIAARGRIFAGTIGSTFSTMIKRARGNFTS